MTRNGPAWVLRCNICGDCASGHGEMPEHSDVWVCGACSVDLDMHVDHVHVDLDLVDLDLD